MTARQAVRALTAAEWVLAGVATGRTRGVAHGRTAATVVGASVMAAGGIEMEWGTLGAAVAVGSAAIAEGDRT